MDISASYIVYCPAVPPTSVPAFFVGEFVVRLRESASLVGECDKALIG